MEVLMFEQILVAVDGSSHSLRAAKMAGDMAREHDVKTIFLVAVYEPIPTYLGEPNLQLIIDARLDEANALLEEGIRGLGNVTCEVQTEVMEGPPADAIIEVATVRRVDLVIVGSRGRGQLTGLILGSTSQKVVGHAPCPVLVVR